MDPVVELALLLLALATGAYFAFRLIAQEMRKSWPASGSSSRSADLSERVRQCLDAGLQCLRRGQYDEAIQKVDAAIALDPSASSAAYSLRAFVYGLRSQHDRAIADLNKAATLSPHDASIYMDRGRAWVGLKEHQRAIEDFDRAIALSPEAESFLDRADVLGEIQDYDRALKDYNRAVSLDPNAKAYVGRGNIHLNLKEYDNAIHDFDRAQIPHLTLLRAVSCAFRGVRVSTWGDA